MNRFSRAALLASFLLAGCHAEPATTATKAAEMPQWSGPYGGERSAATRVLRSAAEWSAFWQQVGREPPRTLDPKREMAVAIYLGEKRTGGFSVAIVGTRAQEGKLVVDYRASKPPPGAMVTDALTAPWAIAIVPRSDSPVVFQDIGQPDQAPRNR